MSQSGLKKCVDERRRPSSTGKEKRAHQEKSQKNGQNPPLFVFLKKNPEFPKKPTSGLGGLGFELGCLLMAHQLWRR